jgi:spermidine/putrescine transport system permease protein
MRRTHRFSFVIFLAVNIFFYAPLLILVLFSFNDSKAMDWRGFSLRWYRELFFNSRLLWRSFGNSAVVALCASTVATIIGTLGAIGMHWYGFRFKKTLEAASYLPLVMPEIIIGVSLLIFFAAIRLELGLFTIFIAHTTFNIPFVLLIVKARLEEFDNSLIEAAYDLGAREIDTLLRVIIPIALPGVFAGFLMAVTLSLEDFVITFFVAGPGSSTLPLHIYSMIRFGVSPVINALSVILIAGTIFIAYTSKTLSKYILEK